MGKEVNSREESLKMITKKAATNFSINSIIYLSVPPIQDPPPPPCTFGARRPGEPEQQQKPGPIADILATVGANSCLFFMGKSGVRGRETGARWFFYGGVENSLCCCCCCRCCCTWQSAAVCVCLCVNTSTRKTSCGAQSSFVLPSIFHIPEHTHRQRQRRNKGTCKQPELPGHPFPLTNINNNKSPESPTSGPQVTI